MVEHSSARQTGDALDRATAHVDRAEELLWECARDFPDDADDEFDRLFERLWAVQNELGRMSIPADDEDAEENEVEGRAEGSEAPFDFSTTDD
ncbi:hypothetical protein [Haloferax marisrubri]|uniref:Uncharacterized protein n=1 Tax=Haloferax marisrubri TaxID=1544719 RepID=A0A2P4NQR5_9EURY|nr:hypothetical protein [Haloferax marisrubri]POG55459.1 hypothetical protein AUR65_008570 [Haloferax marisrubri]